MDIINIFTRCNAIAFPTPPLPFPILPRHHYLIYNQILYLISIGNGTHVRQKFPYEDVIHRALD